MLRRLPQKTAKLAHQLVKSSRISHSRSFFTTFEERAETMFDMIEAGTPALMTFGLFAGGAQAAANSDTGKNIVIKAGKTSLQAG